METPYSQYRHIDDVDEQRIWLALMFTYKNHKLKESKFAYRWFAINFFKEMKH